MGKLIIIAGFVVLIGLLVMACTGPKAAAEIKEASTNRLITLEAFPCRGTCPVFQFTVDEKGRAAYLGKRHVERIGTYTCQLSKSDLAAFSALFEENGWESLEGDALSKYKDIQRIEIQYAGKRVALHKRAVGENLLAIVTQLEAMIHGLSWKAN